jgi:hypothetical protein
LGLGAIWKLSSMRKQPEVQANEEPQLVENMPEASATTEE